MKKLVISISLTISLFGSSLNGYINHLNNLNSIQLTYYKVTYKKAQQFNLENTLTAILWQESDFGKVLINVSSGDCGAFQINASTLTKNKWKQNLLCTRLIQDFDFSFSVALERFKYFYNYWISKGYSEKIAWKRAVCSYHSGFKWKNGLKYYKEIVKKIRALRLWRKNRALGE